MTAKLTISIADAKIIAAAKQYAKANKTSLSKLIEAYLVNVSQPSADVNYSKTPVLAQLIKGKKKYSQISSNDRTVATDYLMEKHYQ